MASALPVKEFDFGSDDLILRVVGKPSSRSWDNGVVVSWMEVSRAGNSRRRVIWDYNQLGEEDKSLIWLIQEVAGLLALVGYQHRSFFSSIFVVEELVMRACPCVRAFTDINFSGTTEALQRVLIRQIKEEKLERLASKRVGEEVARQGLINREEQERAQKYAQEEAQRRIRKEEQEAERKRRQAENIRLVNCRDKINFWNSTTGQKYWGTPVHNKDEMALLTKVGRNFPFAVLVDEHNVPLRVVQAEKRPGGGPVKEHEIGFLPSFTESARQQSVVETNRNGGVPKEFNQIWLHGPSGIKQYTLIERLPADGSELANALNNQFVAVNRPENNKYPVYKVEGGKFRFMRRFRRAEKSERRTEQKNDDDKDGEKGLRASIAEIVYRPDQAAA